MAEGTWREHHRQDAGITPVPGNSRKAARLSAHKKQETYGKRLIPWSKTIAGGVCGQADIAVSACAGVLLRCQGRAVMNSQKLENILNLSLDSSMEEREKSGR